MTIIRKIAAAVRKLRALRPAIRAVLDHARALETPTIAAAVAGILTPILASLLGVHVTAYAVEGWLVLVGTTAATIQKLLRPPA